MEELTSYSDLNRDFITLVSADYLINESLSTTLYEDQSIMYLHDNEVSSSIKSYHTVEWIVRNSILYFTL